MCTEDGKKSVKSVLEKDWLTWGAMGSSHGKASKNKWHLGWFLKDRKTEFFQPLRPVSKANNWVLKHITFSTWTVMDIKTPPCHSTEAR